MYHIAMNALLLQCTAVAPELCYSNTVSQDVVQRTCEGDWAVCSLVRCALYASLGAVDTTLRTKLLTLRHIMDRIEDKVFAPSLDAACSGLRFEPEPMPRYEV